LFNMPSIGELDRRAVLRLIAAGAGTALARCSKPDEPIYPSADGRGDPGKTLRYATSLDLAGYARGVTGIVVDGRPIKLEGLAAHPASLGATDLFTEAAILDLYDPQRLRAPISQQGPASWSALERALIARLAGSDGTGLRLLTGRITSPSLLARIDLMKHRFPALVHVRAEPIDDDAERAGSVSAFGRQLLMRPRLAEADLIVALNADPLGPGPDQAALARAWALRRSRAGAPMRLHVLEPSPTQTGICADRRTPAEPRLIGDVLLAIAAGLGADLSSPSLPPAISEAVHRIQRDLANAKGRAVLLVGRAQPAAVHALAEWVNQRIAAPVDWIAPVDPDPLSHGESLTALATDLHAGKVTTLVSLAADPLHLAPASLGFAEGLKRVPFHLACAAMPSATTAAATWVAPLHHPLEAWRDGRAPDGTASIAQPLLRPLYSTRAALRMIDLIDPRPAADPRAAIMATWRDHASGDFGRWWQDVLVSGVLKGTAATPLSPPPATLRPYPPSQPGRGLTIALAPSPTVWDGHFAGNAWARECPDPLTKEVWGSALRLSATDAQDAGLTDGDVVAIGGERAPIRIVAGQAAGVATLLLGSGRSNSGAIAEGPGANGFALRPRDGAWHIDGIALRPTGERNDIISTQPLFALEGDLERLFPVIAPGQHLPQPPQSASLYPRKPPPSHAPPQWAMAIDTSVCIGCNACVVACQAENNVPAIGPEEMAAHRDMHWLRVDRYKHDNGSGGFQPVPCMQCETAPCEPVCPVEASVHDAQGLNVQVYNRCVGTRTCETNCPYKVRRFNFRDYAEADLWKVTDPGSASAQRNPDVTVRARGVMEKCTYCVQRIEVATHEAHATGEPITKVVTACQAACPTQAIRFGPLGDPAIEEARADPRHYALLAELGTRPRTTYLAKVRDPGDGA
jgi:molybdopterin-containing oxidoreductase family iron-sulfur binding subunit